MHGELLLAKYRFLNALDQETEASVFKRREQAIDQINDLKNTISSLSAAQLKEYEFLDSKLSLIICRHHLELEEQEKLDLVKMENSMKIFGKYGSLKLKMKACLLIAKLIKNNANSCLEISRIGLEIAERFNLKRFKQKLGIFVEESLRKIKKDSSSKFIFCQSYPLQKLTNST